MNGRVLIIAGSDSGGGAGIQADIKTVTALGGYAMTAITALTAQNTEGVSAIHEVPPDFIAEQMRVVLSDLGADVVKIGMLHRPEVIEVVSQTLDSHAQGIPLVLDPVMVAKGGAALLQEAAVAALRVRMLPRAAVLTPNIPEAEALAGHTVEREEDAQVVGTRLLRMGAGAVLLKGGHLAGERVVDRLFTGAGKPLILEGPRIDTRHTHGTGCTLASAVAAGLAQGMDLATATRRARAYVLQAIRTAPGFGHGHGPLNHAHTLGPMDN